MSKRLVILGAGESGTGTAILGKSKGLEVFVSDSGLIKPIYKEELTQHQVLWEEGSHSTDLILQADIIVKSPGIPDHSSLVQSAKHQGIPVISEIEFASQYTQAKHICISGTNGKTTTTLLIYHILKSAGLNVGLAGNVGHSYARLVATQKHDYYVLELSSFQLDGNINFRSHISVLTNITPDHLDRYNYQLENYVASKFRLSLNQQASDYFIYCMDDPVTMQYIEQFPIKSQKIPFSVKSQPQIGAGLKKGEITIQLENKTFTIMTQELSLIGTHNTYNSMAAAIVANLLEVRKDTVRESLMNFQNVEHRLEFVARVKGVDYINDSKATNVNSAWYALESMDKPVIWIAGGVDKGNNYHELKNLVKDKVRLIVCMGIDNTKIHQAFHKEVDMIINTTSAREAVHVASKLADPGECVLLSPACASFDLFENYEDRGRQFKTAVKNL